MLHSDNNNNNNNNNKKAEIYFKTMILRNLHEEDLDN